MISRQGGEWLQIPSGPTSWFQCKAENGHGWAMKRLEGMKTFRGFRWFYITVDDFKMVIDVLDDFKMVLDGLQWF